jgi:hypothetical protein
MPAPRRGVRQAGDALHRFAARSEWWLAICLFIAAADALTLLADGRYRPFPWQLLVLPTLLQGALALLGDRLPNTAREEALLAGVAAIAALGIVWVEGIANQSALAYCAILLLLAATVLWPHSRSPSGVAGNTASAASNNAGADHPAA